MRLAPGFLDAFKNFVQTEPEKEIASGVIQEERTVVDKVLGKSVMRKTKKPSEMVPDRILKGIAFVESNTVPEGKKYQFRKFSGSKAMGDDIGKYQVTEGELKSYSKDFLGRVVTGDEFAASPEIQETYMNNKVRRLREDGLTDEEIAAFHRGGLTGWGNPATRKKKLKERKDYATAVMAALEDT